MTDDESALDYRLVPGTRPENTPQGLERVIKAAQCPDCDSDVVINDIPSNGFIRAEVQHDDTCPWYKAFLEENQ